MIVRFLFTHTLNYWCFHELSLAEGSSPYYSKCFSITFTVFAKFFEQCTIDVMFYRVIRRQVRQYSISPYFIYTMYDFAV